MESDPTKCIAAFYAGRSIFITGSTGFMGKVLVEKILRSCPDVDKLFLLMRPKKGLAIDERLRKIFALPLFDKLRELNPSAIEKCIPVAGDVGDEGLGLGPIERRVLIEEVSVIFHVAANVRFDDPLKRAILSNVRGTREICNLATQMKKLLTLLHVSTTYSNTDRPVIDEVLYPPHADWKETIKIAENIDEYTLNIMTSKYLEKMPNTYTFTKQLAEHVINEYAGVIPGVIFRPSVVISVAEDPLPGWIDNFNGPVGLMVGGSKGVLRSVYAKADSKVDFIPVDVAIKGMIATAWQRGITPLTKDPSVPVYNCASGGIKVISTEELIKLGFRVLPETPLEGIIWFPNTTIHSIKFYYTINFLIFHVLPALLIDFVLKLSGIKARLLSLQKKVYTANIALEFFIMEEWAFKNTKLIQLTLTLPEVNKEHFYVDYVGLNVQDYFRMCTIGAKKFLFKEDMNKLDAAKAHYNRMWWIDRAAKLWFGLFVCWLGVTSGFFISSINLVTSAFDIFLAHQY